MGVQQIHRVKKKKRPKNQNEFSMPNAEGLFLFKNSISTNKINALIQRFYRDIFYFCVCYLFMTFLFCCLLGFFSRKLSEFI